MLFLSLEITNNGLYSAEVNVSYLQTLQRTAEEIGQLATTGKFLDPNEKPSSVLQDMREVRFLCMCLFMNVQVLH